jgi:SAM-dependent methyltransferase
MQAYDRAFARIYNEKWIGFAQNVAPHIHAFYESTLTNPQERSLLDLCCGTGQLAVYFMERGYRATGVDLSEGMLHYARENAAPYIAQGTARFVRADVTDLRLDERFGLAVSTFDALNHLPDQRALRSCFTSVHSSLLPGGWFIFDLNTRAGLLKHWNGISVQDTPELVLINRGLIDEEGERAWVRITGFVRAEGGLYERFEQTAYNTMFDMQGVYETLLETGWSRAHFARIQDLATPLAEPEEESRVFVVACKAR